MSSELVIRAEGLSKSFRVGLAKRRDDLLAARMLRGIKQLVRGAKDPSEGIHWALRDVSFEVNRGDVVALIGHNGAGKSTLLKILARITDPTAGLAEIHGRVGSLLEVGTGFHLELTGRENVYLSGAILGMSRAEIARNFDEIVAFAEVEKFVDTPVKHYSSGMLVRLGFAVATQLQPEILLIDEVLAVGDARFQKKCLDRIQQVGHSDRTIIFVSHNMAAVRAICRTGIVLEDGGIVASGDVNTVVDRYLASTRATSTSDLGLELSAFRLDDVSIAPLESEVIKTFEPIEIRVRVTARTAVSDPGVVAKLLTSNHERITGLDFADFGSFESLAADEQREVGFRIDALPLLPGHYLLELELKNTSRHIERVPRMFPFEVVETPVYGTRKLSTVNGNVALKVQAIRWPRRLSGAPIAAG